MKAFHGDQKVKDKYSKHQSATLSVSIAELYFKSLGYGVHGKKHPCANGPDLTITKPGDAFSVEVKSIFRSSRAWKVSATKNKRKLDDFVALVLSISPMKGIVVVQPMKDHVRLCSKDGSRCVTGLVRLYD